LGAKFTAGTAILEAVAVSQLMSGKPLRGVPHRHLSMDDLSDLAAMTRARREGKPKSYAKLRRELGLS